MRWPILFPLIAAASLLAGCGGDDAHGHSSTAATPAADARPEPNEKLALAAKRLERALPTKDCDDLIKLMLPSLQRQRPVGSPPTQEECDYIERKWQHELHGLKITKTREFGPAGFSEGSGDRLSPGGVAGIVWLLDSDGSWKASFEADFRPQIDQPPALADQADANARRLVEALKSADCDELWKLLNPASRFADGAGSRENLCKETAQTYKDPSTAFAQIKADGAPALETLGRTRDISFYGLRLKNGRYIDVVLAGPVAAVPAALIKQHENPSVLEILTVRQPS